MNEQNQPDVISKPTEFVYLGFGQRIMASVIDTIIQVIILIPIVMVYFPNLLNEPEPSTEFQLVVTVLQTIFLMSFWSVSQSTIGKMAFHAKIVDADTGAKPTTKQFVIRYVGYIVSTMAVFLGFIWIAFDARKQGWHDKMANTVVVKVVPDSSKSSLN